ncbi:nucleotidyltransferase family protein [Bradyrhizobium sp. 195]|uniref:hypothetical protein n=1 Tax=Bradyrhizobium sp. 195 TaxID=2782662 RepID=UPI0020018FE4|nr:hypothetical protein [Bradyrhizobium sp. 195]UPK31249.1 hypothetical protein IVB26_39620 [Bradyrhizobium sp. 195]
MEDGPVDYGYALAERSRDRTIAFTKGRWNGAFDSTCVFRRVNEVIQAGTIIAGDLPWSPETAPEIRKAFTIANNWRDAHAYPMRSVRYSMMWFMRHNGIEGITAARLKRMQAIRRKLRRLPHQLCDLQDLAGCRVILPSIADVRTLVSLVRDRARHIIRDEND